MTPLETQLVGQLVSKYKAQGVNCQRLLGNPDFIALPLQAKLSALENYKNDLTTVNIPDPLLALKSVARAATLSAGGVYLSRLLSEKLFQNPNIGKAWGKPVIGAAIVGGGLGLLNHILTNMNQYEADKAVAKNISENDFMGTLATSSMQQQGLDAGLRLKIFGHHPLAQALSTDANRFHVNAHDSTNILDMFKTPQG